jgi:hypothetical protein
MTTQLPLELNVEKYTLDGYAPPLSRSQTLLDLQQHVATTGGRLGWTDEADEAREKLHCSITVLGLDIHDDGSANIYMSDDRFTIAAKLVNWWLKRRGVQVEHREQYDWLIANMPLLNQAARYWRAVEQLGLLRQAEGDLLALQQRIERGRIVAKLLAYEVHQGRKLSDTERQLKWAELSNGLSYETNDR